MLNYSRTSFDKGYRKVAVVCPSGASSNYTSLCDKYGANNVFRGDGTTDQVAFTSAISVLDTNANDVLYVFPGTYVTTAAISVNKNITITGPNESRGAAIITPATAVVAIVLTAAADYAVIKNLSITIGATATEAITIPASCPGVILDGLIINGADTSTTQIGVTVASDKTEIKNCRIRGIAYGISSSGSDCLYVNNYFQASMPMPAATGAAVGILQTTGDRGVYDGNTFIANSAWGQVVTLGTAGAVVGATVKNNYHGTTSTTSTSVRIVSVTMCATYNNFKSSLGVNYAGVVAA